VQVSEFGGPEVLKVLELPKPVPADLFQRSLELRFRPLDQ